MDYPEVCLMFDANLQKKVDTGAIVKAITEAVGAEYVHRINVYCSTITLGKPNVSVHCRNFNLSPEEIPCLRLRIVKALSRFPELSSASVHYLNQVTERTTWIVGED